MHKTWTSKHSERGFGHIGIILAVVGVIAIGGLVAWRFMGANKSATDTAADSIAQQIAQAKCEYDDKDLCKFFVSWKAHEKYRMVSTSTDKQTGAKSAMTFEIDGDNTHSVMTGDFASETISIGPRTTYIKAANGVWWKQTIPEAEKQTTTDPQVDFDEPATDSSQPSDAPKTTYKSLGKEACGTLTCFKYQVVNEGDTSTTEYLWFDTKDYQIRRTTSDNETASTDVTFSYDAVTVKAPASFKELAPNQYLLPGQSEPTTAPSAADFQ